MELDVLGLVAACSYALDCVETELVHVTSRHAKRVAYMSVCVAEQLGICGKDLQDLAVYALLHDNALTQYMPRGVDLPVRYCFQYCYPYYYSCMRLIICLLLKRRNIS